MCTSSTRGRRWSPSARGLLRRRGEPNLQAHEDRLLREIHVDGLVRRLRPRRDVEETGQRKLEAKRRQRVATAEGAPRQQRPIENRRFACLFYYCSRCCTVIFAGTRVSIL